MSHHSPYNPLEKVNLGISVAEAMLSQPAYSLGDLKEPLQNPQPRLVGTPLLL